MVGTMDEISRRPLPVQKKKSSPAKADSNKISSYFPIQSARTPIKEGLYLIDYKTRHAKSMPRENHTVSVCPAAALFLFFCDLDARYI